MEVNANEFKSTNSCSTIIEHVFKITHVCSVLSLVVDSVVGWSALHCTCVMLDDTFVYSNSTGAKWVSDLIVGPYKQAANQLSACPSAGDRSCLSLVCYRLFLLIWLGG